MPIALQNRGYFPLFRKPAFIWMWLAQTISNLGDGVARIALLFLVTEKTSSPVALTVVALAQALPSIVLAPLAGILVDRANRKAIMVVSDAMRALAVICVAVYPSLPVIYGVSFLMGIVGTVFNPARSATMPDLAGKEHYTAAVAFTQAGAQGMMVLGPAMGGLLAGLGGINAAFVFDAATFLISSLVILLLPIPSVTRINERSGFWHDASAGVRTIWCNPPLRFLVSVYIPVLLVGGSISILVVNYLRHGLGAGGSALGLVESLLAAGIITASLLVGIGLRIRPARLIVSSIFGIGLVSSVFLARPGLHIVAAWALLIGLVDGLTEVPINTMLLKLVPDDARGRVFSSFNAIMRLSSIVSLAAAGPLASLFGAHMVLGATGVVVALIGISARFFPSYRKLNEEFRL